MQRKKAQEKPAEQTFGVCSAGFQREKILLAVFLLIAIVLVLLVLLILLVLFVVFTLILITLVLIVFTVLHKKGLLSYFLSTGIIVAVKIKNIQRKSEK